MKKINFDAQLFINEFNSKIKLIDIEIPKYSFNQIIKIAKNKFSNKNNKEVTFSLDSFNYKRKIYKQICRIIPNTGELGYEVMESKTGKSIFSFLYKGNPLPDFISTIIEVRDYLTHTTNVKDYTLVHTALMEAYSKGFSYLLIDNIKTFFIYENDILTFKDNEKVINTFYIPDKIFDLGLYPNLNKYKDLSINEWETKRIFLSDMITYEISDLNSFLNYLDVNLQLSRNEFFHIASKLLDNRCYEYGHYIFNVDGLLSPAIVIETNAINLQRSFDRFILNEEILKDLFKALDEYNQKDTGELNAFQLAQELIKVLNLSSDKIFQIFSEITLATIENEINLIDNYKLYIYVREGEALLYNRNSLVGKYSINREAFNGIRIDYYHYLSNF